MEAVIPRSLEGDQVPFLIGLVHRAYKNHTLMLGQFNRDVIKPQDAALTVLAGPDRADFASAAQLVVSRLVSPDDA